MQKSASPRWTLACVGFVLGMAFSWASHADLNARYKYERSAGLHIREWHELSKALEPYQIVFAISKDEIFLPFRAFFDNALSVRLELGQEPKWVSTGYFETYEENAKFLSQELTRLRTEADKPLIVIGDPQTGVDVLYALVRDPKLVAAVAKLALISPAFGSPLVDWTEWLAPEALDLVRAQFGEDLRKFSNATTRELFETAIATLTPEVKEAIADHVNYVRLAAPNMASVAEPLRPGYVALRAGGKTDAISYTADQKLESLGGHDLGVLRADHWDFWVSSPISNSSSAVRRAFTRALLGELIDFPGQH